MICEIHRYTDERMKSVPPRGSGRPVYADCHLRCSEVGNSKIGNELIPHATREVVQEPPRATDGQFDVLQSDPRFMKLSAN